VSPFAVRLSDDIAVTAVARLRAAELGDGRYGDIILSSGEGRGVVLKVDVDVVTVEGRVVLEAAGAEVVDDLEPPHPRRILSALASPPSPFFAPMRGRFAQSWSSHMRCLRQ